MICRISEIATVVAGATPSTEIKENYDGDIYWITPKDLSNNNGKKYIRDCERKITNQGFKSCSTTMIPANNILISTRAPIGYIAINSMDCCTNQGFKSLVCNNKFVDVDYLYYYLNYKMKEIEALGSGTTFKEVSKSSIENFEIDIPDLESQRKISKILATIDDQIERNNAMVNKLQVLAQSTFHYFFANFASKKEPLSSFIVEYKKSMLQVNEVQDTKGTIPFFTSGDTVKYIDRNLVDGFNLFLSTGGNASVKSYYGKASYSTDTWCITAKNDMQFYIFEYLKMIENQMDSLYFHGTGLKHLQKPLFLNSEIPVPVENLSKYNTIVEPIFKKISDIQKGMIKLNKLKNKLLPLLINQQLQ